mgnify:CR=1 FL=1
MLNPSITYENMLLDVHNELKTMLCDAVALDYDPDAVLDIAHIQDIVQDISDLDFLWACVQAGGTPNYKIKYPSDTLWSLLEEWGIDCQR